MKFLRDLLALLAGRSLLRWADEEEGPVTTERLEREREDSKRWVFR